MQKIKMKAGYSNGSKRIRTIDWKNFHYYQTGQVADYIPALAEVDPKQLGMAIYDLDTKQLIEEETPMCALPSKACQKFPYCY